MEQEIEVMVLLECLSKIKLEQDSIKDEVGNFNDFIGFYFDCQIYYLLQFDR